MTPEAIHDRRQFLGGAVATGSSLLLASCSQSPSTTAKQESPVKEQHEEEVSPAEDLMREHGVLKRVLLIYREGVRRIDAKQEIPPDVLSSSANLIRKFIEDYHEKLEEEYLFPRFRKAGRLVELVNTLEEQHKRGRTLTETIIQLSASAGSAKASQDALKLKNALQAFVRMYEPHEAREDTELFPEFRKIVPSNEYDALGEDFEKKEHELFGEDGFDRNVAEVARIEKVLGIYDLTQFTPPA